MGTDMRYYGNGHVFLVDWSLHASTSYAITVYRTKIYDVARVMLKFLEKMREIIGVSPADFYRNVHGVGHSMGAHILGILGYNVFKEHNVKLAVIIALDPAGLMFYLRIKFRSEEEFFHVDKNAADKVMILHTTFESQVLSLRYAVGHYDYYAFVREGYGDWCEAHKACKHMRAINFFKASLEPQDSVDNQLVGFKCDADGKVGDAPTSLFGIHHNSDDVEGVYYIPINMCSPYNQIVNKKSLQMKRCVIQEKNTYFFKFISERRKTIVKDVLFDTELTYEPEQHISGFRMDDEIPAQCQTC